MKVVFGLLFFVSLFTVTANAQWQSSQSSCYAYTDCFSSGMYGSVYNGRIACQTYGSAYAFGPASTGSACSWYVVPGRSVQCSGFSQTRDYYGNFVWGWQNFSYVCPY